MEYGVPHPTITFVMDPVDSDKGLMSGPCLVRGRFPCGADHEMLRVVVYRTHAVRIIDNVSAIRRRDEGDSRTVRTETGFPKRLSIRDRSQCAFSGRNSN